MHTESIFGEQFPARVGRFARPGLVDRFHTELVLLAFFQAGDLGLAARTTGFGALFPVSIVFAFLLDDILFDRGSAVLN